MTQLSVIIPVLNEAACIQCTLSQFCLTPVPLPSTGAAELTPDLAIRPTTTETKTVIPLTIQRIPHLATNLIPEIEVIVVDGGSQDTTVELAQACGARVIRSSVKGRAQQMNQGAAAASGDILLFLHADTQLPLDYWQLIHQTLGETEAIAGAFELKIDSPHPSLRWIERIVTWRSRHLGMPYGDQALFLKASVFEAMGGYRDLPIMEDFELVQRLRSTGKVTIATAAVLTSGRRWNQLGIWQTTLINQLVILGYFLGISPQILVRLYGRH